MWFIKKYDWWFLGAVLILVSLSLVMLLSLGSRSSEPYVWVWRQMVWVAMGVALLLLSSLFDYRILRNFTVIAAGFYVIAVLLMVAVLVWGKDIRGSRGWFEFGSVTIQPVEFMKIALLVMLAKYFSDKNVEIWRFRHIAVSAALTAVPLVLALLQPDWGSGLVLGMLWFVMVLFSGARANHVMLIVLFLMFAVVLSWFFALTHAQKARIMTVFHPRLDPYGISYSQRQAVIAVGSGGLLGKGIGQGTQTQLKFLTEGRTDFIFAAIAEELGFLGVLVVLICYGMIFFRIFVMTEQFSNNFSRLFSLGFLVLLGFHIFVNIGMNLGVLPVVGLALPFVSYGGSSILTNFLASGIVLSMKIYKR